MRFEIGPVEQQPVIEEGIFVDGQRIGEIKKKGSGYPFHAALRVPKGRLTVRLAQGHGNTPEEAIHDALVTSRKNAREFLEGLDELAELLEVEIRHD